MTEQMTAQAALDRLETLYTQSVTNLRDAVRDFVNTGERPDPLKRADGVFAYPELRIRWDGDRPRTWSRAPMLGCRNRAAIPPPSPGRTCSAPI